MHSPDLRNHRKLGASRASAYGGFSALSSFCGISISIRQAPLGPQFLNLLLMIYVRLGLEQARISCDGSRDFTHGARDGSWNRGRSTLAIGDPFDHGADLPDHSRTVDDCMAFARALSRFAMA